MTKFKIARNRGLSLVELMVGVTILIVVLVGGFAAMQSLSRAFVSNVLEFRADRKLQSIADTLRQRAGGEFEALASGDYTCQSGNCSESDQRIQVTAYIDPIDPATRTRFVTLKAEWKDRVEDSYSVRTSCITFHISPIRTKLRGGRVKVAVTWCNGPNAGQGVPGIVVTGTGDPDNETPTVSNVTGSDGTTVIGGLLLPNSGSPIVLTYAGVGIGYFAADATAAGTVNGGSWQREVSVSGVNAQNIVNAPAQCVYALTEVSGVVDDVGTNPANTFADGVTVQLKSRKNNMVINDGGTEQTYTTVTENNGQFSFANLVPGQYSIHVIGDVNYADNDLKYAAVARRGDNSLQNRVFFTATSGTPKVFDDPSGADKRLETAERGSLEFDLAGINFDSAGNNAGVFVPNADCKMGFWTRNVFAYIDGGMANGYAMDSTVPWVNHEVIRNFSNTSGSWSLIKWVTTSGRSGTINHIVPNILVDVSTFSPTKTLLQQYGRVELLIDYKPTYTNATPVYLFNNAATLAQTKARFFFDDSGLDTTVPDNPDVIPLVDVHSGHLLHGSNNNFNVYLLGTASYGNITGKMIVDGTADTRFDLPSGADDYVLIRSRSGGFGWLYKDGPYMRLLSERSIEPTVGTERRFDFRDPNGPGGADIGYNPIPPTFGNPAVAASTTTVTYNARKTTNANKDFRLDFRGYEKIWNGSAIVARDVTSFSPSISNLEIRFYDGSAPWNGWTIEMTRTITTSGSSDVNRSVELEETWFGRSSPEVIRPNTTTNVTISVAKRPDNFRAKYVGVNNNHPNWFFQAPATSGYRGYLYTHRSSGIYMKDGSVTTLPLVRRGRTGTIQGRVLNGAVASRPPLVNAEVSLWRSGGYSDLSTRTDGSGNFSFTNVDFVMLDGANIRITAGQTGYYWTSWLPTHQGQPYEGGAYQDMNYTYPDITLMPIPVGGGGGEKPRL